MKILAINLSTSGERIGGASISAELHSFNIYKFGVNINLWKMWSYDSIKSYEGLTVRYFESKSVLKKFSNFLPKKLIAIFLYSDIPKQLIAFNPDIVHIHNIIPSFELLKICRICKSNNIKLVITTHGFYECFYPALNTKFLGKLIWKLVVTLPVKKSISMIDAFLSLYPLEAKLLRQNKISNKKIFLVPNGVDKFYEEKPNDNEINYVLKKYNLKTNFPILFFTGNHTSNKGLDVVKILTKNINIQSTVIIGGRILDKNEPNLFVKDIYNKNVKVIFTDFLPIAEQRALYHISSLLLFPSKSDTLPLTIIEAMACGLPVIAFDVGGINFLLNDDCGYLIKPNCVEDYIRKVNLVLLDKNNLETKSKNALKRQKEIFSWSKAAEKTIDIYKSLNSPVYVND